MDGLKGKRQQTATTIRRQQHTQKYHPTKCKQAEFHIAFIFYFLRFSV